MPEPSLTPEPARLRLVGLLAVVLVLVLGALWWQQRDEGDDGSGAGGEATPSSTSSSTSTPTPNPAPSDTAPPASPRSSESPTPGGSSAPGVRLPRKPRIVVVSVDGLASYAVSARETPVIDRLLTDGAGTLNARTAVERTVTLPNHTGMVTGRRINAAAGGHGVTWNVASRRNVRSGVPSVFSSVDAAGGSTAVFAGKAKFRMWERSWPGTIDRFEVDGDLDTLTDAVVEDLATTRRELLFLHIAAPDAAGHHSGWASDPYDDAVASADAAIGRVVDAIEADHGLAAETLLVVTADHGGAQGTTGHADASRLVDFRIPFVVWGPGVAAEDLYDLNPDYADPGDAQPGYAVRRQPVRNASVANLVLDLLRLPPVPGSEIDARQDLDVR